MTNILSEEAKKAIKEIEDGDPEVDITARSLVKETPREQTIRLLNKRLNKAIYRLSHLTNIIKQTNYVVTEDDMKVIEEALKTQIDILYATFESRGRIKSTDEKVFFPS